MLKKKNMHKKKKKKKKKQKESNTFKYGCKRISGRCGSYRIYLEGDSPHQTVMTVCELNLFSYISNCHNMKHLYTFAMFLHTTRKILCYFWYMCKYNVIWPSQGIHVLMYPHETILTCFWNIKLVRLVVCVCVYVLDYECFAFFLVERCFWELNMLIGSLFE